ncbi:MAG TPA: HEAT repeat domain-containing protein [Kofleriaceae bacterium]|nr:HEAT repeat domain-containing protein [Kofleriaceae bacterium]
MSYLFPSPTITFEAALRDIATASPKGRIQAARALGDVEDAVEKRRAYDALVAALDDDQYAVRAEACASLGQLGDASALPHLVKRLDDGEPPVRQNAAIALGTLRAADGFEPLATALREGPADLRYQAATSIAEIDPERAFEPVMTALGDRDAQVVGAAALSVGAIAKEDAAKKDKAIAALVEKLEHKDANARFDVAYALAELGRNDGADVLAKYFADEERAWDAVTALVELDAKAELVKAAESKRTVAEARVLAAGKVLALDASQEFARAVLIESLTHRKPNVRGLAIEQLRIVGGTWAKAPLEKLARSGKGEDLIEPITGALAAIKART